MGTLIYFPAYLYILKIYTDCRFDWSLPGMLNNEQANSLISHMSLESKFNP